MPRRAISRRHPNRNRRTTPSHFTGRRPVNRPQHGLSLALHKAASALQISCSPDAKATRIVNLSPGRGLKTAWCGVENLGMVPWAPSHRTGNRYYPVDLSVPTRCLTPTTTISSPQVVASQVPNRILFSKPLTHPCARRSD